MPQLIEVQFKAKRSELFSNPRELPLRVGDHVVVAAERGESLGMVTRVGVRVRKKRIKGPVRSVKRLATAEDLQSLVEVRERERRYFELCREKIAEKGLPMKLVDAEAQFDANKVTFFFTAEGRVDFRSLVKELAQTFKTRIELRQIGVRDHARRLGGLGVCGLNRCCASVLREFEPVTLKMARDQHLALSPSKISGVCGRLMCCLAFEHSFYTKAAAEYPRPGTKLAGPSGAATVVKVDLLRDRIYLEEGDGKTVLSQAEWLKRKGEWRVVSEGPPVEDTPEDTPDAD
jgi:cell fate regulator YaaT (PSP1 superfamily)